MKKEIAGICPNCGSAETIYQDSDFLSNSYYDRISCDDCGCVWQERFDYKSYKILEEPLYENSLKI